MWNKKKFLLLGALIGGVATITLPATLGFVPGCAKKQKQINNFSLNNSLPNELFGDYEDQDVVLTTSNTDQDVSLSYSLDNDLNGYLTLDNTIGGGKAQLRLAHGLTSLNIYSYKISVLATKQGYQSKTLDFNYHLKITGSFEDFTINDNTPTDIAHNYITRSWVASADIEPTPDSISWSLIIDPSSELKNKLSIDSTTGRLTLLNGLSTTDYQYKIVATAHHRAAIDKTITSDPITLTIHKANLPVFGIGVAWNSEPTYGYSPITATLSLTNVTWPTDYTPNIEYSIVNNPSNLLEVDNSTSTLTLKSGLPAGEHSFSLQAKATGDGNYNDEDSDIYDSFIEVAKANYGAYTISNTLASSYVYNTSGNGSASIFGLPDDTSINWSLVKTDGTTPLDGELGNKLIIDQNTGAINLFAGLDASAYEYKIKAALSNSNYNDTNIISGIQEFAITKANYGSYTISNTLASSYVYNTSGNGSASIFGLPDDTIINWSLVKTDGTTPLDGELGNKLIIDQNTGAINLFAGLDASAYEYKIKAALSNSNYNDTNIISGIQEFAITKANYSSQLSIESGFISTCSYSTTVANTPTSIVGGSIPNGTTVTWSLIKSSSNDPIDASLGDYLKINSTTGDMSLLTGLNCQTYNYRIKAQLSNNSNYNDTFLVTASKSLTVTKINFTENEIKIISPITSVTYNYSATSLGTASLENSIPPNTNIAWSLTNVDTTNSFSSKISIASNGVISLATGLPVKSSGNYTYSIKATLTNPNYNDLEVTSNSKTLTVNKANFSTFTMKVANQTYLSPLQSGYGQQTLSLTNTCSVTSGTTFTYEFDGSKDAKFSISGSNLIIATGLGNGTYTLTLKCKATNPNYVDKYSTNLSLTLYVYTQEATRTNDTGLQASSTYGGEYPTWKAFDGNTGQKAQCFATNQVSNQWISINLNSPKKLIRYTLIGGEEARYYGQRTWRIEGSTDNSSWVTLHNGSSSATSPTLEAFSISYTGTNLVAYQYYRIYVLTSADSIYSEIAELSLFTCQ